MQSSLSSVASEIPARGSQPSKLDCWSQFPAIYCINLKERDDRLASVSAELARVGVLDRVEFYRPERDPRGGLYGCWESHTQVFRMALEKGLPYVLIFEDDVVFSGDWEKSLSTFAPFVAERNDWDLFFFLYTGWDFLENHEARGRHSAKRMGHVETTAAYVASADFMRKWLAVEAEHKVSSFDIIDQKFSRLANSKWVAFPAAGYQSDSETDLAWGAPGSKFDSLQRLRRNVVGYSNYHRFNILFDKVMFGSPRLLWPAFSRAKEPIVNGVYPAVKSIRSALRNAMNKLAA